jgi:hypothetical protein
MMTNLTGGSRIDWATRVLVIAGIVLEVLSGHNKWMLFGGIALIAIAASLVLTSWRKNRKSS